MKSPLTRVMGKQKLWAADSGPPARPCSLRSRSTHSRWAPASAASRSCLHTRQSQQKLSKVAATMLEFRAVGHVGFSSASTRWVHSGDQQNRAVTHPGWHARDWKPMDGGNARLAARIPAGRPGLLTVGVLQKRDGEWHEDEAPYDEVLRRALHAMEDGHQRPPGAELVLQLQFAPLAKHLDAQQLPCRAVKGHCRVSQGLPHLLRLTPGWCFLAPIPRSLCLHCLYRTEARWATAKSLC